MQSGGIEPPTPSFVGSCSIQLSYDCGERAGHCLITPGIVKLPLGQWLRIGKIAGVIRRLGFQASRHSIRFVRHQSINLRMVGGERLEAAGPLLIAPTHMGHIEPLLLSGEIGRPVFWVARSELFRSAWGWVMRHAGTIEIDPNAMCTQAMRTCVRRLQEGQIVGIFPEGRVTRGPTAAVHGAPVYGGAALLSLRTGVPIVPIVVLGTDRLITVESWLPGNRTPVAIGVGDPVVPPPLPPRSGRRAARRALTVDLGVGYEKTYADLTSALARPGPFRR